MDVVLDINNPGSLHQKEIAKMEKKSRKKQRETEFQSHDFGDDNDSDFDDEEEYNDDLDLNYKEWSVSEDDLLRTHYATYSKESNIGEILQSFLDLELKSKRSVPVINHRLRKLGLMVKSKRKKNNKSGGNSGVSVGSNKRRVKPVLLTSNERKNIIYRFVHKAIYENASELNDVMNGNAFKWIASCLESVSQAIAGELSVDSNQLSDDIAVIPIEMEHFEHLNNLHLVALLSKLGFLAPNKAVGTCWWRIPREFKTVDIDMIISLIKEALELEKDVDLNALCGALSVDMTVNHEENMGDLDDNNDGDIVEENREPLQPISKNMEIDGDSGSDGEEEYVPGLMSIINKSKNKEKENINMEMEIEDVADVDADDGNHDVDEKEEKKKAKKSAKKKKKKKQKKKKKSRKRKRKEMDKNEENDVNDNAKKRRLIRNDEDSDDDFLNDAKSDEENVENNANNKNDKSGEIDTNVSEDDDAPVIRKRRKRAFVSDSDED